MSAIKREERIGGQRLLLGNCLEIMDELDEVDHVISDPPYEAVMQNKWGTLSRNAPSSHVRHEDIGFDSIDEIRPDVTKSIVRICNGWAILFCMAEGVRAWRDEIEKCGAKYKRAMVWIKPDAMPQFNGMGPSVGHEMMVSAWCGPGRSKWNGGGRPGNFIHNKNTPGGSVHPTQKPLPLMKELVQLFSSSGQTVLDPFMGSGTTLLACQFLGINGIGIERDEKHFDAACKRVDESSRQPDMFVSAPQPKPIQEALF